MTNIQDTLTYVDGSPASGRLVVYWDPFTVGSVSAAGGMLDYEIVKGQVSIRLYANAGAQPTGIYYNAKYELENGKVYVEQWIVPNLPVVNLGQVRVNFPPTPSVMISPTQLTSMDAQPGQFLQWDGSRWVPTHVSTINVSPNSIGMVVDGAGSDVTVTGSPVALGSTMDLHIPDASPTARGVVTTGAQSFGGNKTFQGTTTVANLTITGTLTGGGMVPISRQILGDATIAGGGDLSADRTLSVVPDSSLQRVRVGSGGTVNATRPQVNFIGGSNFVFTVLDNPGQNRADVALTVAAGAALVTGVFGRTGNVVALAGDYTAAQVTGAVDTAQAYANPAWITSLAWGKITGAPATGVASVFSRTGAVLAAAGDYTAAQVTNAVDSTGSYANPAWISSLAWGKITGAPATVPPTRQILGDATIAGGGDLSADRTLSVVPDTTNQRVQAALAGTVAGTRPQLNFIAGPGQTLNVADNAASNRVDITISASGTGPATPSIYSVNGAVIGTRAQLNLISGTNVTLAGVDNSGASRVDITVTATGAVTSVFGRGGAVVAAVGDYTAAQVTNAVSTVGSYADPVWITSLAWAKVTGAPAFLVDPLTTKGDILARGTTTTRLPVGTDGQVLTADSTQALGLKWVPAAAGSQTPWTSDINGANFALRSAGQIGVGNDATVPPFTTSGYVHLIVGPTTPSAQCGNVTTCWNATVSQTVGIFNFANYAITAAEKRIAYISGYTDGTIDSGAITFGTWNTGVGGERMRITAAGNVGIGTASPLAPLHVTQANSIRQLYLTGSGAEASTKQMRLGYDLSNNTAVVEGFVNSVGIPLLLNPSGGNVGIGTNPQSILHCYRKVNGGIAAIAIDNDGTTPPVGAAFRFRYGATGILGGVYHDSPTGSPWYLRLKAWSNSAEVERFTIRGDTGNVGIGVTNPQVPLDIGGNTAGALQAGLATGPTDGGFRLFVRNGIAGGANGTEQAAICMYYQTATYNSGLRFLRGAGGADGWLAFDTSGQTQMSIYSNGNVGIGTTNPTAKLQVAADGNIAAFNGTGTPTVYASFSNGGGATLLGLESAAGGSLIVGGLSYATTLNVQSGRALQLGTGNTARMTITAGGTVAIGTTSPSSSNLFQVHTGTDQNFSISPGVSFPNAVCLNAANDAWSVNTPLEIRASNIEISVGGLGIGKPPGYLLDVAGDCNISGTYRVNGTPIVINGITGLTVQLNHGTVGTRPILDISNGAFINWHIVDDAANNKISGYCDNTNPSDLRIKRNIVDLVGGLSVIDQIRPVESEYNGLGGTIEGKAMVSVIAQELQQVLPRSVIPYRAKLHPTDAEETELLSIEPFEMLFQAILAIKQLHQRLKALEGKVN